MADATTRKLLQLLEPEHPSALRRAAVLVLSEVADRDRTLADALCSVLDDPDPELRMETMKAVGRLKIEPALPQLLERVQQGGSEGEIAAHAAANLGARGVRALQDLMSRTVPGLRRKIAAALAAGCTPSAESAAVEALLDGDAGVVAAAVHKLISEMPTLTDAHKRQLADRTLEYLDVKKPRKLSPHSESALVRLLAATGDSRGEAIFWQRTDSRYPPLARAEALQALGKLPTPSGTASLKRLLECAADRDFRVVAPALMILKAIPVTDKTLTDWLPLLDAPDVATRRFAIEKLADLDNPELARALVAQISHPDRNLREEALAALGRMKHGHLALADQLLAAATSDEAWPIARAQARLAGDYSPALRKKLLDRACKHLDDDDRLSDPLLFVLRQADPKELRDRLADRAGTLRKKKKYDEAMRYLRLLAQDPACGEGLRFELAGCGLKLSPKDLTSSARQADPCLANFARLVHNHETPPIVRIEKASWLDAADLFYLGFHFAEGSGAERDFGGQLLRLVLKKAGRTKLARDARAKLRGMGFD